MKKIVMAILKNILTQKAQKKNGDLFSSNRRSSFCWNFFTNFYFAIKILRLVFTSQWTVPPISQPAFSIHLCFHKLWWSR